MASTDRISALKADRVKRFEKRINDNPSFESFKSIAFRLARPLCILLFGAIMKYLAQQWVVSEANAKFTKAGGWGGIYATIPLIAGLTNLATNKLAVWMIFNPINFIGKEMIKRKDGQPGTLFGWQGIIPAKVKKMGGNIADMIVQDLLDVKTIFSSIDSQKLSNQLVSNMLPRVNQLLKKKYFGDENINLGNLEPSFNAIVKARTLNIVKNLIESIKEKPDTFIDIRHMISSDLEKNKQLICDLFQSCGRNELSFIVWSGLFGGE